MARTEDLQHASIIECAPNGIVGTFIRWEDNCWHHQDADISSAAYTDDEISHRCGNNINIIEYML